MKTALIAIARNESRYLVEWLRHYKALGFDHVTLFDNDDRPNMRRIVGMAGLGGFCTVDERYVGVRRFVQTEAYRDEYTRIRGMFDWILFADVDEFLALDRPLKDFLSDRRYSGFDEVRMNWRVFTDSGRLRWSDEPVVSRFTEALDISHPLNTQCKSIVRGGIKSFGYISCHGISGVKACNVHGAPCESCQPKNAGPPIWDTAVVNHYKTKTIEEYIAQKVRRGDNWNKHGGSIDDFFAINEKTEEKMNIIKEMNAL